MAIAHNKRVIGPSLGLPVCLSVTASLSIACMLVLKTAFIVALKAIGMRSVSFLMTISCLV